MQYDNSNIKEQDRLTNTRGSVWTLAGKQAGAAVVMMHNLIEIVFPLLSSLFSRSDVHGKIGWNTDGNVGRGGCCGGGKFAIDVTSNEGLALLAAAKPFKP